MGIATAVARQSSPDYKADRSHATAMGEGDTLLNALVGAVVTVVLSFTGFSPLVGGGVAGYLQRGERMDGARVGAIAGVIATIPFLLAFPLLFGLVFTGSLFGGYGVEFGLSGLFGAFLLVAVLFAFVWNVVLSAVGGYVGVYLATETDLGD